MARIITLTMKHLVTMLVNCGIVIHRFEVVSTRSPSITDAHYEEDSVSVDDGDESDYYKSTVT